jgi:hypothetical protein
MRRLLAQLLIALLPLLAVPAARAQFGEAEVKAAFVYNVAKFAEWPVPLPPGAPLRLCVLGGPSAFGTALAALEGKAVQGRALEVRAGTSLPALRPCHLLVLMADVAAQRRVPMEEQGTLTLGDSEGFVDAGGMMEVTIAAGHVQFEVNLEAVRRGGIRLPAQLLKLARRVKGQ